MKNKKLGIKRTEAIFAPKQPKKKRRIVFGLCAAATLIVIAALAFGVTFYGARALPNIKVGNVDVSNADAGTIRNAVKTQAKAKVTFIDDKQQKTSVSLRSVGVIIDADTTVKNALNARREGNFWDNIQIWNTKTIPLVYSTDPGVLKEYIATHYPSLFVDAKDAQLVYSSDSDRFEIINGGTARVLMSKNFKQPSDLMSNPRNVSIKLATSRLNATNLI